MKFGLALNQTINLPKPNNLLNVNLMNYQAHPGFWWKPNGEVIAYIVYIVILSNNN